MSQLSEDSYKITEEELLSARDEFLVDICLIDRYVAYVGYLRIDYNPRSLMYKVYFSATHGPDEMVAHSKNEVLAVDKFNNKMAEMEMKLNKRISARQKERGWA